MKIIYPGLNAKVEMDGDTMPGAVHVAAPDPDYQKKLIESMDAKTSRRYVKDCVC